jgi:hypothetical protein
MIDNQGTGTTGMALHEGMMVFAADRSTDLGSVKEIRDIGFVLDRPMKPDVVVPFSVIASNDGQRLILNVEADQIEHQSWGAPGGAGLPGVPGLPG